MVAEILSVGTELLLGQIVDTNAAFLSQRLAQLGVNLYTRTTVGDNQGRLVELLRKATERSDLVILTGGIGPTPDDITREALAELAGVSLVEWPELRARLEEFFVKRGRPMTNINLKQATLPEGAEPLENPMGTAPGIWMRYGRAFLASMPGVPHEMEAMFERQVVPRLQRELGEALLPVYARTLRFCGVGESALVTQLEDVIEGQTNPTLGTMAGSGEVKLRIAAQAASSAEAEALLRPVLDEVTSRMGTHLCGYDDLSLEQVLLQRLEALQLTLAVAESCTGGQLAKRLTDVPGASKTFLGGVICYSNQSKQELLGVSEASLRKQGAVSEQVALELAAGVAERLHADLAIGITGIAGPEAGTPDKPVGTVWLGYSYQGKVSAQQFLFHGDRWMVRMWAVQQALAGLWEKLGAQLVIPSLGASDS